jgi:signal transduction histidine kinase
MSTAGGASPDDGASDGLPSLAWAVLAAIGAGASAAELRDRLYREGAAVEPGTIQALTELLKGMGLLRISRATEASKPQLVRTHLGDQFVAASFTGATPVAARLRDLEQLRGDLLATVAHELRTPLTSIRTSVGLLLDPAISTTPEQRRELLARIERNASAMQQHADDVLDLTRFRSGQIRLGLRRFDARVVPHEVQETMAPTIAASGQQVRLLAPEEPVWAYADHRRIERAVLNLLSNAQKFSADGATIEVRVEADAGEVSWIVRDEGVGIPPHHMDQLFERFFVGGDSRGSGTGLGLPIALAIAQAHGGRIDVESRVGVGSSFRLTVPADGPAGEPA